MKNFKWHQQFVESVHGALFFGVPNQGMKNDELEKIVGGKPNNALVSALREDSQTVTDQNEEFNYVIQNRRLDVIYFYEHKKSAQTVQVS
jgi:hypothetical protein